MKPQAIKQHYITEFVNSGMSQQEAEEKWNEISHFIDENGWSKSKELNPIDLNIPFKNILSKDFGCGVLWRPKSLQGLENNRGWTAILSEKDLPSEDGYYWIEDKSGKIEVLRFIKEDSYFMIIWRSQIVAYQENKQPPKRIY